MADRRRTQSSPTWELPTWTAGSLADFTPAPAVTRLWLATMSSVWTMSTTAQQVIWLRLSKLASEGATLANQREVQQMISEKMDALHESASSLATAGLALSSAVPGALSDPKQTQRLMNSSLRSANKAMRPFSTRVKANHRRLSAN